MRSVQVASILAFAGQALGHGYIWRVTADNTVYPGWDIFIDATTKPAPARIAYGGGQTGPVLKADSKQMACNQVHTPAPGTIAEVRAGSNMTFFWSRWLHSHKGPMTAWMAPYTGDVSKVDVNQLEFIKFAEDTIDSKGVWSTDRMMDVYNNTWTAQIPADIKPGNYIIRQEILALHFAVAVPPALQAISSVGPQFYMTCFNVKVTGDGTAAPKGAKFPGAYDPNAPGFKYDLKSNKPYPVNGPAVYVSSKSAALTPKPVTTISPTGNGAAADATYFKNQDAALASQAQTTEYFDSIGG